jgi:hypothetical protein
LNEVVLEILGLKFSAHVEPSFPILTLHKRHLTPTLTFPW